MTLTNYFPTFRNVLLQAVEQERTSGGIYIPLNVLSGEKEYLVIKAGKDCLEVKPGDLVRIMTGMRTEDLTLGGQPYFQLPEQQIIGYTREDDSIRTTPKRKSKATASS